MTGLDKSQGKLIFPPRFVPYLEKHRIYELFHELAELLIRERPKDHVKYLREALPCAATRRNKPRIVFLAPPSFDRVKFAREIARILGIPYITRLYLEMKERERRILERMKRQEAKAEEEEEEEEFSCVCPGESEFGEQEFPLVADAAEEAEEQLILDLSTSQKPSTISEEEDEDPCHGMRVCPCKELQLKREEGDEATRTNVDDDMSNADIIEKVDEHISVSKKEGEKGFETVDGMGQTTESTQTSCICESEETITINFGVLNSCEYSEKGWILVDFPNNAQEAELLSEQGALPTHAILLITDKEEEKERTYKYMVKEWSTVYRSVPVMQIHVYDRGIRKLAQDLSNLLREMPHRHAPMLPRVVLIGSRGSGATTQAKLLSNKYGLVHVEFQEEMARVVLKEDKFSETYKRQLQTRPDPELEAAILEKILLKPQCRKRGWVLTGYPTNSDQLRMLDIMVTPPNRIIFIEVPAKECFIRLYYRKTDWTDGREYKIPFIGPAGMELRNPDIMAPEVKPRLMTHPRDDKRQIIHDIEQYFEEKVEMMNYCGRTAAYINGNKSKETVFEMMEKIVFGPPPAVAPRDPLAVGRDIEDTYERLKNLRMDSGITVNNLMMNPPDPIFKL